MLTNVECWEYAFNRRVAGPPLRVVSSISSNGYYGFSRLIGAYELNTNTSNNKSVDNGVKRRKRFYVREDENSLIDSETAEENMGNVTNEITVAGKRCRFDEDFEVEHCNDIIAMPSTGIVATQSCLMDMEEYFNTQQQFQEPNKDVPLDILNNSHACVHQQQFQEPNKDVPLVIFNDSHACVHHQQSVCSSLQQYHQYRDKRDASRYMLSHMI